MAISPPLERWIGSFLKKITVYKIMVTIFITSFFSLAIASVFLLWLQNLKVKKLNQIIIDQDIVIDELEQEVDDWFGSYLRATVDKTKLK